ncbi:hypothetical protein AB0939_20515 [Streptomyces sp. NPDC006990]|uniref:hypothetical protein n=1 Tax=unclassified Streptomyces TaxID=2593676 RepID=UPI00345418AC
MGDRSRPRRTDAEADAADATGAAAGAGAAAERASIRTGARAPLPRRDPDRFADGPPDPLASLLAKVTKGETVPAPGSSTPGAHPDGEERDPREEEWREHDRRGPYGQGRRRRN